MKFPSSPIRMNLPLPRMVHDENNGFVYEAADRDLTRNEWQHISNELCFTKRFQLKYTDLFNQHLFPKSPRLVQEHDKICNVLVRMNGRDQHEILFMNTLQLHMQTAIDVQEYMQSVFNFSSFRMEGVLKNGLEGDNLKPNSIYEHWSEDEHTLGVMILDLEGVISHVRHNF